MQRLSSQSNSQRLLAVTWWPMNYLFLFSTSSSTCFTVQTELPSKRFWPQVVPDRQDTSTDPHENTKGRETIDENRYSTNSLHYNTMPVLKMDSILCPVLKLYKNTASGYGKTKLWHCILLFLPLTSLLMVLVRLLEPFSVTFSLKSMKAL